MDELTQLTIVFSVIMLVTLPLCTYAGYRVGHFRGHFRGYAAARQFLHKVMNEPLIYTHQSHQAHWSVEKVEKE